MLLKPVNQPSKSNTAGPSASGKLRLGCLLCSLTAALLSGCSSFDLIPSDSLIQRLKGRGPVLVSPENPYLAANLLLSQEAKQSKELAGFLDTRGLPSALAVSQRFFNPARLKFFYKDKLEQYDLELLKGVWVIEGPEALSDQSAIQLLNISPDSSISKLPAPATIPQAAPTSASEVAQDSSRDELVPLFEDRPPASKTAKKDEKNLRSIIPAEASKPEVVAQQSELESAISYYGKAPAETTPAGDIVHFVTSEKETIKVLTLWYTKTVKTLSRILRANKLDENSSLAPGDQIIIPAELVKNKMRMPEEAIGHF